MALRNEVPWDDTAINYNGYIRQLRIADARRERREAAGEQFSGFRPLATVVSKLRSLIPN